MSSSLLSAWEGVVPVVGMVHLLPLPGSPGFSGNLEAVRFRALKDADALVRGGVHGLLLENFGDVPYHPGTVPSHTVAYLTAVAREHHGRFDVPLGINVLRNDGTAALAVAHAAGAEFIRVNVLSGARVTDQGVLEGIAHRLLRERSRLSAGHVRILADVAVKHSTPLGAGDLEQETEDLVRRAGADGIVVTGRATGKPVEIERVRRVRSAAGDAPVFVGSGVTRDSIADLLPEADGFIVGSHLKVDGRPDRPVAPDRVTALLEALEAAG